MQLWHMGRVAHTSFFGLQPLSPSAVAALGEASTSTGEKVSIFPIPWSSPYHCNTQINQLNEINILGAVRSSSCVYYRRGPLDNW